MNVRAGTFARKQRSYGSWTSPITAEIVAASAVRLSRVLLDGDDLYWLEGRPSEGGRCVVVRRGLDGGTVDVTPPGTNVRTRVHEYGGAAYVVSNGVVVYAEFRDQRLYRLVPGHDPEPLTEPGSWYYGDASIHPSGKWLVCVREDHASGTTEPVTTIVLVALDGSGHHGDVVAAGHDFYSTPRFSPDGRRLCWLAWNHPQMPWDGTELWAADVTDDGDVTQSRRITGDETDAIFQPGWSPEGTLYFVSDRTGWWNLYRALDERIEPVCPLTVDCGRPQWQLGMSTWAFADARRVVTSYQEGGRWRLGVIDLHTAALTPVRTDLEPGDNIAVTPTHAFCVGGFLTAPESVVRVELDTGVAQTLRRAADVSVDEGYLSRPESIEFPTSGGLTAHGFLYAPRNRDFIGPPEERPPLIVICHGGPTASTSVRLNLEIQFWTSRGFAVADVNYGGSSGYGRAYRRRLKGQWGIVDVADCIHAARYLADTGQADGRRLLIRGRSAGGYTTLAALAFHPGVFRAGASYYGISDLEAMARETHKFESRYLEGLLGPYPEALDVYRARSPIHAIDRIASPLIVFQGSEDRVVPPNQSQRIADALRARGVPATLLTFDGEQHGFRKSDSITRCLTAELAFFSAILGLSTTETH